MDYVYGLKDPRDNKIKYVGCSHDVHKERIAKHMWDAKNNNTNKKCRWLKQLAKEGLLPELIVFAEGNLIEMETIERALIGTLLPHIINISSGGISMAMRRGSKASGYFWSLKKENGYAI